MLFKGHKLSFWIITVSVCFFFIGIVSFFVVSKIVKNNFDQELYNVMAISLAAVNPDRIERLAATSTNLLNPDYVRLKEQFLKLRSPFSAKGVDSIYVVKRLGDEAYFVVDSFLPDDKRYSPPGELYRQPPLEILQVVKTEQPAITNVYTDEYGTFLSYFAPIKSFITAKPVGIMGVDIDYSYYISQRLLSLNSAVVIVIILYLSSLVFLLYFFKKTQTESAIREAQKLTKKIIDVLPDVIYLFDPQGKFILWNQAMSKVSGYSEEEISRMRPTDFFVKSEVEKIKESIKEVYKNNYLNHENHVLTKSGKIVPFEFTDTLFKDEQGRVIGIVGSGHDISPRRQRESELEKQRQKIEKINQLMIGRELRMIELKKELENHKTNN